MAFGLDTIIARIEWLERHLRRLAAKIEDVEDKAEREKLPERKDDREGEIVIVRPAETVGMASFTEAVTGPPYQAARLVPDTGLARIWQTYDPDTGELRALNTVQRWDPEPEPDGTYSSIDARVTIDNINPSETIPSTARYVVCVRRGGRLIALTWECT